MWRIICCAALAAAALATPSVDATQIVQAPETQQLRRGINILAHDPIWKGSGKTRFQLKHFEEIRRGGFDFVRVNLFVFEHMDAHNRIDPQWLQRLDWVVRSARKAGLSVILDEHDSGACRKERATCGVKLAAVWRQLARRYSAEPSSVSFELLNEPDGIFDARTWNAIVPELLSVIRETNPTRRVIVALIGLDEARLPAHDRKITATFHYYDPFPFTHQGAPWTKIKGLRGTTWGSAADRQRIRDLFDKISDWGRKNERPILLGEFGVYEQSGAPLQMRVDYTAMVACEAERRGFAWAYWQFAGNFIAWDMVRDSWVAPIKDALIPPRARPTAC